jgi:hypothetical protein
MAGGTLLATSDVSRIEAPVTVKAYLMCAFASFGGIFFGFDSVSQLFRIMYPPLTFNFT